jgi:hypothetical protein
MIQWITSYPQSQSGSSFLHYRLYNILNQLIKIKARTIYVNGREYVVNGLCNVLTLHENIRIPRQLTEINEWYLVRKLILKPFM